MLRASGCHLVSILTYQKKMIRNTDISGMRIQTRLLVSLAILIFMFQNAICQENDIGFTWGKYDSVWVTDLLARGNSNAVDSLSKAIQIESMVSTPVGRIYNPREISDDALLCKIIRNFTKFGVSASPEIRNTLNSSSTPVKEFLTIILGFQGDSSIKEDLRTIIATNGNPTARELAAYSLGGFKDTNDILLFKEALSDTFWVTTRWDYSLEDGRDSATFYPVRQKAADALISMGFKVTHDFSGNYTILEEPK